MCYNYNYTINEGDVTRGALSSWLGRLLPWMSMLPVGSSPTAGVCRNMLEVFVSEELRAADRSYSDGEKEGIFHDLCYQMVVWQKLWLILVSLFAAIHFQSFLGMYKRLFSQCRSVVSLHRGSQILETPFCLQILSSYWKYSLKIFKTFQAKSSRGRWNTQETAWFHLVPPPWDFRSE